MDWNQVRAFLATVETGSFSAAARQLGLTQPTLGRQVAALERDLGVTLFERTGRNLLLTQAGTELVAHVRAMGEAAARLSLVASGQSQSVEGSVRITASDIVAAYVLPPALERLAQQAPGITVDVLASNHINDLIRREADIAIRHVRPDQPELIARRCPDMAARLYASKRYMVGREALDATELDFIGFSQRNEEFVAELNRRGLAVTARQFSRLTNSGLVEWEWVQRGLGVGTMMEVAARQTPDLVSVFDHIGPIPVPIWLVTHRELHTSRRIRLVFDLLAELLA